MLKITENYTLEEIRFKMALIKEPLVGVVFDSVDKIYDLGFKVVELYKCPVDLSVLSNVKTLRIFSCDLVNFESDIFYDELVFHNCTNLEKIKYHSKTIEIIRCPKLIADISGENILVVGECNVNLAEPDKIKNLKLRCYNCLRIFSMKNLERLIVEYCDCLIEIEDMPNLLYFRRYKCPKLRAMNVGYFPRLYHSPDGVSHDFIVRNHMNEKRRLLYKCDFANQSKLIDKISELI